jgi:FMN phosphatase YigB (HAD superfamily)
VADVNTYKILIFDLDDTLLDTSRWVVPFAARESCQVMINHGLKANLEECIEKRKEIHLKNPRANAFELLVQHFGVKKNVVAEDVKAYGQKAFFERNVNETIALFDGADEVLENLQGKYKLYMVTAGNLATQMQKIRKLHIESFFQNIFYIDPSQGMKKGDAFKALLDTHSYLPEEYLSIGNRADHEIAEAKDLKMKTCLVEYGEYVHLKPSRPEEIPDFRIRDIRELVVTCRL